MKNLLANIIKGDGILHEPGDHADARITKTGRNVIRVNTNNGMNKYSATKYSNGTVVETKTTKRK